MQKMNLTPLSLMVFVISLAGCASTDTPDRQPGQVLVCHGQKTIVVSNPDYLRHIEHGDTAGPCAE